MTVQGSKKQRTFENIKGFWNETAKNNLPTIRDIYFQDLEIREIIRQIQLINNKNRKKIDTALDIGCGVGFATRKYSIYVNNIIGADYSEEFINNANSCIKASNIKFQVEDVTDLSFPDESFDLIVGERILINLPTLEKQHQSIDEIIRVLKVGGTYIAVEVTEEGHMHVNRFRRMFGLDNLERYWHNLYIDEIEFIKYLNTKHSISNHNIQTRSFGLYHFLSKVINPLLSAPDEPSFDDKINKIASEISDRLYKENKIQFGLLGKCSHHKMFIITKE